MIPDGYTKMIEGKGKFINRPSRSGKRTYDKFFIYIPTEIARDGLFPLKSGEEVTIKIDQSKKCLIIKKE